VDRMLGKQNIDHEDTFSLDNTIEDLVNLNAHSTLISEAGDVSELPPDQDHRYLLNINDDSNLLRAKILSMEISLKQKNTLLEEENNYYEVAVCEISELKNQVCELEKQVASKNEALDIATAQFNSCEESKLKLQTQLRKYSKLIRMLTSKEDDQGGKKQRVDINTINRKKLLKRKSMRKC